MTLSKTVEESLNEATLNLRNALAFSARSEKPFVCKEIASIIHQIDNVKHCDEVLDMLENQKNR